MSYQFTVNIAQADAAYLSANGYNLAVQKSTPGSTTTVQWLSVPVLSTQIIVSWTETFQVFFTVTALQLGATITQNSYAPGAPGNEYTYANATFTNSGSASAAAIAIKNGLPGLYNYGIAQSFTDQTGVTTFSPIAAAAVLANGGVVTFTPKESIILYFTQTLGAGLITTSNVSNPFSATLAAGSYLTVGYNGGKWSGASYSFESDHLLESYKLKSLREKFSHGSFVVSLASGTSVANFVKWLNSTAGGLYSIVSKQTGTSSTITITAIGASDPSAALSKLGGTFYTPPPSRTLKEIGYYEVNGEEVQIESVLPVRTLEDALFELVLKHIRND